MGVLTSIWIWLTEDESEGEGIDFGTAEIEIIERLIDRFSGFAGVEIEDGDGNPLEIGELPNPNAPDGGMDCVIVIYPDNYANPQAMLTRVKNIIIDGDY
jgi:hypothetical protein